MRIPAYLALAHASEETLASSLRRAAEGHPDELDIVSMASGFAAQCEGHLALVGPMLRRYGTVDGAEDPPPNGLAAARAGSVGLLRDLQDLWMLASFVHLTWTVVEQAANGLRDHGLATVARTCDRDTEVQLQWLTTRIKQVAPQALIVGR